MLRVYRIAGSTTTGMRFELEVAAVKPYDAVERVYSLLCGRHKLARQQIRIESVIPIAPEQARSRTVKTMLALDKIMRLS